MGTCVYIKVSFYKFWFTVVYDGVQVPEHVCFIFFFNVKSLTLIYDLHLT